MSGFTAEIAAKGFTPNILITRCIGGVKGKPKSDKVQKLFFIKASDIASISCTWGKQKAFAYVSIIDPDKMYYYYISKLHINGWCPWAPENERKVAEDKYKNTARFDRGNRDIVIGQFSSDCDNNTQYFTGLPFVIKKIKYSDSTKHTVITFQDLVTYTLESYMTKIDVSNIGKYKTTKSGTTVEEYYINILKNGGKMPASDRITSAYLFHLFFYNQLREWFSLEPPNAALDGKPTEEKIVGYSKLMRNIVESSHIMTFLTNSLSSRHRGNICLDPVYEVDPKNELIKKLPHHCESKESFGENNVRNAHKHLMHIFAGEGSFFYVDRDGYHIVRYENIKDKLSFLPYGALRFSETSSQNETKITDAKFDEANEQKNFPEKLTIQYEIRGGYIFNGFKKAIQVIFHFKPKDYGKSISADNFILSLSPASREITDGLIIDSISSDKSVRNSDYMFIDNDLLTENKNSPVRILEDKAANFIPIDMFRTLSKYYAEFTMCGNINGAKNPSILSSILVSHKKENNEETPQEITRRYHISTVTDVFLYAFHFKRVQCSAFGTIIKS